MKIFKNVILVLLIFALAVGMVACDNPTDPETPPTDGDGGGHVHVYDSFHRDETNHKAVCSCGASQQPEAHTWGASYLLNCATFKDCTVCGYKYQIAEPSHNYKYTGELLKDTDDNVISFSTLEKCSQCGNVRNAHYGLPDVPINTTTFGTPFSPDAEQYIRVKLSMTRDEEFGGRLIYRHLKKTYVTPFVDINDPDFPGNIKDTVYDKGIAFTENRLAYVSDFLPYDIYRADYKFTSNSLKTPNQIFSAVSKTHVPEFYNRFFNFIRFVYAMTESYNEGVVLSFEFDTSFIYQANGYVVRAKVTVDDAGNTTAKTIEELCSKPLKGGLSSICDVFGNAFKTRFNMRYLTHENSSTTLKAGDSVYCDININIPLADSTDGYAWETFLAKNQLGISSEMYNY